MRNNAEQTLFLKPLMIAGVLALLAFACFGQKQDAESVAINKVPIADFWSSVANKIESRDVSLDDKFDVEVTAIVGRSGSLEQVRTTRQDGSKPAVALVKNGILALSDSGIFSYLTNLDVNDVTIRSKQDGSSFLFSVEAPFKTPEKARTVASALNGFTAMAKLKYQDGQTSERMVLDAATVSVTGNNMNLKFVLPKLTFQQLVLKEISRQAKLAGE